MALTEKQKRFVEEYLIDLNATQAAIRAGYSAKTANEQGARLLVNVSIQKAISRAMTARSNRTNISQERVVNELAKIAFLNISDIIDQHGNLKENVSRDDMAGIEWICKRIRVPGNIQAEGTGASGQASGNVHRPCGTLRTAGGTGQAGRADSAASGVVYGNRTSAAFG